MPYQWNDFLWCKWYGKMPNNRMLTLRRFPIPVEDNLQIAESKAPLVPIAQAVTWWGGDTGNKLSSVLNIDYGYNWIPKTSKMQDVTGNEISAEALLDTVGATQTDNPNLRKILLATLFQNNDNLAQHYHLFSKLYMFLLIYHLIYYYITLQFVLYLDTNNR